MLEAHGCSLAELIAFLDAFATFAVRDLQVLRCSSAALAKLLQEGDIEQGHVCDLCDSLARLRPERNYTQCEFSFDYFSSLIDWSRNACFRKLSRWHDAKALSFASGFVLKALQERWGPKLRAMRLRGRARRSSSNCSSVVKESISIYLVYVFPSLQPAESQI